MVFTFSSADVYMVQQGDSLYKISKKYHTTVAKIMEINDIKNQNDIQVNQVLQISSDDANTQASQVPTKSPVRLKRTNNKSTGCSPYAKKMVEAYEAVDRCSADQLFFGNGRHLAYSRAKASSFDQALKNASLEDMFRDKYKRGKLKNPPRKNYDPGRYRNDKFFRYMYGNTSSEVRRHLTTISWFGKKIRVTTVNNVHKHLKAVERDLQRIVKQNPSLKKFLTPIGGTFTWRKIAGTHRLSVHSFGAAIDINVKYSAYWRWNKGKYRYHNKIPQTIVDQFEKHGFIWGGKWYHYDTMHFEYRPELIR